MAPSAPQNVPLVLCGCPKIKQVFICKKRFLVLIISICFPYRMSGCHFPLEGSNCSFVVWSLGRPGSQKCQSTKTRNNTSLCYHCKMFFKYQNQRSYFLGGVYRGSDDSLQVQKYCFYWLQKFKNCLKTVYSFTFLSSTVYKQKIGLILQSTGFKIKPITVYRISINTPLS